MNDDTSIYCQPIIQGKISTTAKKSLSLKRGEGDNMNEQEKIFPPSRLSLPFST